MYISQTQRINILEIRPRVNLRKNHVTHVFNISKLQKLQNIFERSFVQYVNKQIKVFLFIFTD